MSYSQKNIRNFCIIAHIDHGKSTLADRLLEYTETISERELQNQLLDDMDLERERGITIKSHAIQMNHSFMGTKYILNLIDTPGHVDFSYEVSRSIAACEGALLIVDAAQGIEAQTISNLYLALENDLKIIPVMNKIDLDSADIESTRDQIIDLLGCEESEVIGASGKTGQGIEQIIDAIINKIPPPSGDSNGNLQALIFDSVYNPFRGIEAYFKIVSGSIKKNDKVKFFSTGREYYADEIGTLRLDKEPREIINTGDVGYIISGIKNAQEVKVGDTITSCENSCKSPISGFEEVKPMVFSGIYPVDTDDYEELRSSLEKLQLNDASLTFEPESSIALGFGFRCGFLGMLHMEIIQERLEREFNMSVINTVPNVSYYATLKNKENIQINNPSDFPSVDQIEKVTEPYIKAQIITKSDFIGQVMNLCIEKRGVLTSQVYLTTNRVELSFEMPLAEIVFDFYDKLKSISKGYASFDYQSDGYKSTSLVKLDIMLNGDQVDALSSLLHKKHAFAIGKKNMY